MFLIIYILGLPFSYVLIYKYHKNWVDECGTNKNDSWDFSLIPDYLYPKICVFFSWLAVAIILIRSLAIRIIRILDKIFKIK